MYGSRNYHNCSSPTVAEFAKKIKISKSAARRLFYPDEWHHCYLKYGNDARAFYYNYSRSDVAQMIKNIRNGASANIWNEYGNITGPQLKGAEFLIAYIRARKLFPLTRKTMQRINNSYEKAKLLYPAKKAEEERREKIRFNRSCQKLINDPLIGLMDRLKKKLELKRKQDARETARLVRQAERHIPSALTDHISRNFTRQKKRQEAKKEVYGKIITQHHHGSGEEGTGK